MKRLLSTTSLARGAAIRKAGLAAALPFSLLAIAPVHADPMSMNDKMSMLALATLIAKKRPARIISTIRNL